MIKFIKYQLLVLVLVISLYSCGNNDDPLIINGVEWEQDLRDCGGSEHCLDDRKNGRCFYVGGTWYFDNVDVYVEGYPNNMMKDNITEDLKDFKLSLVEGTCDSDGNFTSMVMSVRYYTGNESQLIEHAVTRSLIYDVITEGYYKYTATPDSLHYAFKLDEYHISLSFHN